MAERRRPASSGGSNASLRRNPKIGGLSPATVLTAFDRNPQPSDRRRGRGRTAPRQLEVQLEKRLCELGVEPLDDVRGLAKDVARDRDGHEHPVEELRTAGVAVTGAGTAGGPIL